MRSDLARDLLALHGTQLPRRSVFLIADTFHPDARDDHDDADHGHRVVKPRALNEQRRNLAEQSGNQQTARSTCRSP
jgi:hypothetical protein